MIQIYPEVPYINRHSRSNTSYMLNDLLDTLHSIASRKVIDHVENKVFDPVGVLIGSVMNPVQIALQKYKQKNT